MYMNETWSSKFLSTNHGICRFTGRRGRIVSAHTKVLDAGPSNHHSCHRMKGVRKLLEFYKAIANLCKDILPLSVQRLGGGQTSCMQFFFAIVFSRVLTY